jgi:plasmid stabilization system protein ParE
VTIRWSARARRHLQALYDHIAADSPDNAARVVDRIVARLSQMETFPNSGRVVPEIDFPVYRELIEPPYRIIYRVGRNAVFLVAIIHGSRILRPELLR